jgi:hypothetical protein
MRGLKLMNECARFSSSMVPYIDGELDPGHAVDMEAHVLGCSACADRVATARETRLLLRRCAERKAPESLRSRIGMTIATERSRHAACATPAPEDESPWRRSRAKYIGAFAAAAGIFAFYFSTQASKPAVSVAANIPNANKVASFDDILDELVDLHARPLPPETTNPEDLQRFDPFVGVPVRRPAFPQINANFNGARMHAARESRAALLQYTLENLNGRRAEHHRVTIYVFDPRAVSLQATRLRQRVVRERPVYVGTLRGYSIAAAEQRGVGYAFASDLGDDESTQMVTAALQTQ